MGFQERRPIDRFIVVGCKILFLIAFALVSRGEGATPTLMVREEHAQLLASAAGPIRLRSGPTVIALAPEQSGRDTGKSLAAAVRELAPGERIYLVLRNPSATTAPGVLYWVFLDLPAGLPLSQGGDRYVGTLNFFAFTHPSPVAAEHEPWRSFDLTSTVQALEAKGWLSAPTSITIFPAHRPLSESDPTIGRIELVRQ